jgi:cysteinyl-tRNA synthetase
LYTALNGVDAKVADIDWSNPYAARFKDAMNDDFNTAEAVAVLFELAGEVNRTHSVETASLLKSLGGVLGLLDRNPAEFLQAGTGDIDTGWIEEQIKARLAAKKGKDYAEADRIRQTLKEKGIELEDKPGGITEWRRA